jgi:hypothetical protein
VPTAADTAVTAVRAARMAAAPANKIVFFLLNIPFCFSPFLNFVCVVVQLLRLVGVCLVFLRFPSHTSIRLSAPQA